MASGTAGELKSQVGQRTITATLADPVDADTGLRSLKAAGLHPAHDAQRHALTTPVTASRELAVVVRALDEAGVEAGGLALDDVYLALPHPAPTTAA